MIALIQRVAEARVAVGGETVGAIGAGLLVLLGVERDDSEAELRASPSACSATACLRTARAR